MIGTYKLGGTPLFLEANKRTSMPASVVMSKYFTFATPDDNDGIVLNFIKKIISWFRNFSNSACKKPVFFPDRFHLRIEYIHSQIKRLVETPAMLVVIE